VERVTYLINTLFQIASAVDDRLVSIELWLRVEFGLLELDAMDQTVILLALAASSVLVSMRLLRGWLRTGVVLGLLLLGIHLTVSGPIAFVFHRHFAG